MQILLPYDDSGDDYILYRLRTFLRNYSLLNTHITFDFVVPSFDEKRHLPATQPMIKSDNKSSIQFYELHEFRQMVKDLSSKNDTFYDMFQRNFKSANNLPKNNLTMMSLGELSKSNEKIEEIFNLRDKIPPISVDENLGIKTMIPFNTSKRIRKTAIKDRLANCGISCESFKYKQDFGYYAKEVRYPYFIEVFIGRSKNGISENLKVIQSVNSKISKNISIFNLDAGKYYEFANGRRIANSIGGIFGYYKLLA